MRERKRLDKRRRGNDYGWNNKRKKLRSGKKKPRERLKNRD